jgi:hypothetical protein
VADQSATTRPICLSYPALWPILAD